MVVVYDVQFKLRKPSPQVPFLQAAAVAALVLYHYCGCEPASLPMRPPVSFKRTEDTPCDVTRRSCTMIRRRFIVPMRNDQIENFLSF